LNQALPQAVSGPSRPSAVRQFRVAAFAAAIAALKVDAMSLRW
jgi:hypothetical protein